MPRIVLVPIVTDCVTKPLPEGRGEIFGDVIAVYTGGNVWVEWSETKEREVIPAHRLVWDSEGEVWEVGG